MKNFENYHKLYDWKKPLNRKWVDNEITKAPIWCSVDLRDGNQALPNPMNLEEKIEFFKHLVKIGFKEIEVGFPAASETEYQFVRYLIENNVIPEDVKIQVLTQAREDIISKTFESLKGIKNAIVHLYNSTSKIQREVVFNRSKEEIKQIAVFGANIMCEYIKKYPETNWQFEYSPESFTNTEIDYAIDVINAVIDVWLGKTKNKIIINFPATVETSTSNVFADQIEYVLENIERRSEIIASIHSHNDRGTGVATSEMAILAGADRIEGSLFGNGERTGNADILNIAMNMYVLGVDPKIDFSDINKTKEKYEKYIKMPINPRHPYVGELVFTAFSGSHQDAISKGLRYIKKEKLKYWEVPYLPINPKDVNRHYEPIIRINSQSGKGGVSFILEGYGYEIPKEMKQEVGYFIKNISDNLGRELSTKEIYENFIDEYENRNKNINLESFDLTQNGDTKIEVVLNKKGKKINKKGEGNGPIDAFINILKDMGYIFELKYYGQSAQKGKKGIYEKSNAITYVSLEVNNKIIWAIGKDESTIKSSLKSILSAINKI